MATTALDIIKRALRSLNQLGIDEIPSTDMTADAFDSLNDMLAAWGNETLMVYHFTLENFPLVPGQAIYTMGTGGNFNTARPVTIQNAYIRWNQLDYPLQIVNTEQYDSIGFKTTPSQIPYLMQVDQQFPLTQLKLFPVPNDGTAQIFIESRKPFTQFTTLTDPVNLPDGYARALRYNLAIELVPEYGPPTPALIQLAMSSKKWLKRTNFQPLILNLPDSIPQGFGYYDRNGNYL